MSTLVVESPVVKIENVEKNYKIGEVTVSALRGVNMELGKGEFIAIMGPSGSGKTTLLNLIGALDKPSKGKVYIDGKDLTTLTEKELTELRRHKTGFIFQFYNLIPVLSAFENVELPMLIAGISKGEREKRALELLELVGLADRGSHRPDELSGGEQQRVAIARSLSNRPAIVLADEPTGDLDTKTGNEVMQELRSLSKREGATVIVVTHDPIVAKMANRIFVMRDGIMVEEKLEPEVDIDLSSHYTPPIFPLHQPTPSPTIPVHQPAPSVPLQQEEKAKAVMRERPSREEEEIVPEWLIKRTKSDKKAPPP